MKRLKNLQVGLIGLAFLITLGCLFGGQLLTNKVKVEAPLKRALYHRKDIRHFDVKNERDGIVLSLKLRQVKNLQKVLEYAAKKTEHYYGLPVKGFKIIDHRNPALEHVRYKLGFYIEEAAVTGHYIQLKQALDSLPGIDAKAYIGQNGIYLQLDKGNNYLYEVIPLPNRTTAVNHGAGGDSV